MSHETQARPREDVEKREMMSCASMTRQMTFVLSMLTLLPRAVDASPPPAEPAASLVGLTVSFKLDPRVIDPTHGGMAWISPHTYLGANAQDTVHARAEGIDAKGRLSVIGAKWIPSDPTMVKVSPGEGNEVRIVVKRAGQSKVKVIAGGVWQELAVQSRYQNQFIQIAITQLRGLKPASPAPAKTAPVLEDHLAQRKSAGEVTLPGGLRFTMLERADGPTPNDDDLVEVRYRVLAPNGKEVDSSHAKDPAIFRVAEASWKEALKLMPVGSRSVVVLPARPLPPSENPRGRKRATHPSRMSVPLLVEVELLSIQKDRGTVASSPGGIPTGVWP